MTISIPRDYIREITRQTKANIQADPTDKLDVVWKYPEPLGQGTVREIKLRDGLELEIVDLRLQDSFRVEEPEEPSGYRYHFHLLGQHQDYDTVANNREFVIYGAGCKPADSRYAPPQTALEVTVWANPERLSSFVGDEDKQLPKSLQHLIRSNNQIRYTRVGKITPRLEAVLWQIIRCPYQGITKRIYLEGKILDLMSLVIAQEVEIYQGERSLKNLNSGTVDRIHYARSILLQNISNPPTIAELAKRVKLNEYTLKSGFHRCFKTTIFRYLHEHRLEQAQQLLSTGDMTVTEVMNAIGDRDRHYFAKAFRKRYQVNPRDYLMRHKSIF
ncbi:MAG: AraC family transcriptional regulator [Pleurocapsa sp. MO_226.B13]|nr:AraC family transcriptional regulator [Pleurocapsa sp. MO_226.B13]